VDPYQALKVELLCNSKFGSACLDGSGLSEGAVKGIIAGGCIFVVLASAFFCVVMDVCHRSGQVTPPPLSWVSVCMITSNVQNEVDVVNKRVGLEVGQSE